MAEFNNNGELVQTYCGVDSDGSVSNARSTWTIHGSWFKSQEELDAAITELSGHEGTISVEWMPFDD